jgi:hypothetical protein
MRAIVLVFLTVLPVTLLGAQDTTGTLGHSTLLGQIPDFPVRVTLRDGSSERRLLGHLTAVTRDSLILQVSELNSVARINRSKVIRIERQVREISVGKAAAVGCLAFGGVLALSGSQVHDPDSPGIEKAFAAAGMIVGCGLGGLGGAGLGLLSKHQSWEEIRV